MENEKDSNSRSCRCVGGAGGSAGFGGIYGLAFIGAAVYFIQRATTFLEGVIGFFKALFWPAVIMYRVLELLGL